MLLKPFCFSNLAFYLLLRWFSVESMAFLVKSLPKQFLLLAFFSFAFHISCAHTTLVNRPEVYSTFSLKEPNESIQSSKIQPSLSVYLYTIKTRF